MVMALTEEETKIANRYHTYMKGWEHATSTQAMDDRFSRHTTLGIYYREGYEDGHQAKQLARTQACEKFGYVDSLLRKAE